MLFYYFIYLGLKNPINAINQFIIFTVFYYMLKYSLISGQNYMIALWIDSSILGLSIAILISSVERKYVDNRLLIKIMVLILYGIVLLFITVNFNDLSKFKAIDKLRDYMLFPILSYLSYLLVIKKIENSKIIFKTIAILCGISMLIFLIQFFYINIFDNHPSDLLMVRNRYGKPIDSNNYNYEFVPLFYLYKHSIIRIPGIFVQSHQSAHLMAVGFICLFSIYNHFPFVNKKRKSFIGLITFIYFVGILMSFIKMAIIMVIVFSFFHYSHYFIIKPYKLLAPIGLLLSFTILFLPIYERFKIIIEMLPSYVVSAKSESINQFIARNDFISIFTGSGYLNPLVVYNGLSGDDFFIFFLIDQIGLVGILLFSFIILPPVFYSFKILVRIYRIEYILNSLKGIIIIGLISTFHYSTVLAYGTQAIFYISIGMLYGLKWWDKELRII